MSHTDDDLYSLARRLGGELLRGGGMLAAAESCTGGWISKVVTDVPGSSQWFDRGFVTYSNAAKQEMLGVPAKALDRHGAVSEAVVESMAVGALRHSRANYAVAVSGVAGPDGGTPEKPVGTVWIAWAEAGAALQCRRLCFDGDREAVRRQTVAVALEGVLKLVGPRPQ